MSGAQCPGHDNSPVCVGCHSDDDDEDDCYHCDDSLPLALLFIVESFDDDLWGP